MFIMVPLYFLYKIYCINFSELVVFQLFKKLIFRNLIYILFGEVALRQFSRDINKFVAVDILCYIILFYCIILLFQILN